MRKLLLLSFTLIFVSSAFGQIDFMPVGTEWHYEFTQALEGLPNSSEHSCISYEVVGDTIADSLSYRIIKSNFSYTPHFYARYEADSSLLKFYLANYVSGALEFYSQIDYNLSVGDTFLLHGGLEGDVEMTVDSITHMYIGQDSLKVFHLGNEVCDYTQNNLYLIEGYGTNFGLCQFIYTCVAWNIQRQYLDVFIVNQDTIIGDYNSFCSNFTVSSESPKVAQFKVYPNPASDVLNIEGIQEEALLQVISLDGKLLIEKQITPLSSQVPLPANLPNGLYFVRIRNPNDHQILRVVIMR